MKSRYFLPFKTIRVTFCLFFYWWLFKTYTYSLHGGVFANARLENCTVSIMQNNAETHSVSYLYFGGIYFRSLVHKTLP